MKYIGVDGCHAGWIAVTKHHGKLIYRITTNATDLIATFPQAKRILIDVPIGLPWSQAPNRACEQLARRVLDKRRSSVFPVPCRNAVHAETFEAALVANRAELGRGLSIQSWCICNKIAEIDDLLVNRPKLRAVVRETHPEVCFWGLAGETPMQHSKKTRAGLEERLGLLSRFEPSAEELLKQVLADKLRREVAADDVLDALVAFVVSQTTSNQLKVLQGDPAKDQLGLNIGMVYARI